MIWRAAVFWTSAAIPFRWRVSIAGAATGKPFAEPDKVVGGCASRPVGRRRVGLCVCCIFRAALSPRSPAASRSTRTIYCVSSARKAASRCRTSGSRAATATSGQASIDVIRRRRRSARRSASTKRATSIPSRPTPPARLSFRAGRNSRGRAWIGLTASALCACSTNGGRRLGSNMASRRPQTV